MVFAPDEKAIEQLRLGGIEERSSLLSERLELIEPALFHPREEEMSILDFV